MVRSGATAMVTGAGHGIGEAIAHRLGAEDFHVAVVDLDATAASAAATDIRSAGGRATGFGADIASEPDLARVFSEVDDGFPPLKTLVSNAGIALDNPYPSASIAEWRRAIDVNLVGTILGKQLARERMLRSGGGFVVNVCSTAGLGYGPHSNPEYAATKAAIARLTAASGVSLTPSSWNFG
jgi:NAD(P)-dependent dehydrogenase (short-subunit alcohol dehydrogenase family)